MIALCSTTSSDFVARRTPVVVQIMEGHLFGRMTANKQSLKRHERGLKGYSWEVQVPEKLVARRCESGTGHETW